MKTRERSDASAHLEELARQHHYPVRPQGEHRPNLVGYFQLRDVYRSVAYGVEERRNGSIRRDADDGRILLDGQQRVVDHAAELPGHAQAEKHCGHGDEEYSSQGEGRGNAGPGEALPVGPVSAYRQPSVERIEEGIKKAGPGDDREKGIENHRDQYE